MTRRTLLVLLVLAACKAKPDDAAFTGKYPGTDDGARQLLTDLRAGDAAGFTAGLKPTSADYKAVFVDAVAARVEAGYERLWATTTKPAITADPAAVGIELHRATTEDLQQWTERAEEHFPASYKKIAAQLRPGLTIYQWKFTAPSIPVPKVYDGLIFVNQHWVWMPRPWRVLD